MLKRSVLSTTYTPNDRRINNIKVVKIIQDNCITTFELDTLGCQVGTLSKTCIRELKSLIEEALKDE